MKHLSFNDWTERAKKHEALVSPIAEEFLERRFINKKHPVYDFLFTYYSFSPTKLKQWVPSFEESLSLERESNIPDFTETYFSNYWFTQDNKILRFNYERLNAQALSLATFIKNLCEAVLNKTPRFGCFGLHEWAMVYQLPQDQIRHTQYRLRLSHDELASFVKSQNLRCTHYDAYRFFTDEAKPLNQFKPTLEDRILNEQAGCLHANMDLYKWATKLWPWIGSDFIAKTFMLALKGREIDMRASPYDLTSDGYLPICIETESGKKEYQELQFNYYQSSLYLREELKDFCNRFIAGL